MVSFMSLQDSKSISAHTFSLASLSMFTTAKGGIIDDCIVTRTGENTFYIVSNAGRADADLHHIKVHIKIK